MCIRQIDAEPYEAEDLSAKHIDYLSVPVKVFDLDFYDVLELNDIANNVEYSKIIEVSKYRICFTDKYTITAFCQFECLQDATLTSIAVWFELDLDEEITITTDPRCEERVRCWEQGVCHLVHPIDVRKGEVLQFEVTVLDNQLKFYQV